jgi:cullin 3
MDRTYVAQQQRRPVNQLSLDLWRDLVARSPRLMSRLVRATLDLLQQDREGNVIEKQLVKEVREGGYHLR